MATEWAVQIRTLVDGPFDRLHTSASDHDPLFTRETAQEEAENYNRLHNGKYVIARVVSRKVSDWEPVHELEENRCNCHVCSDIHVEVMRKRGASFVEILSANTFIVCDTCGNKRCPHATFHGHECSKDNTPGQSGSVYGTLHAIDECSGCAYLQEEVA